MNAGRQTFCTTQPRPSASLFHTRGCSFHSQFYRLVSLVKEYHALLTIQRQPVMLGGRQGWQSSGFVFKHHRIGDDLIVEGNLQSHEPSVMS